MSEEEDRNELDEQIAKIDEAIAGDDSEDVTAALKQALNYDWPEIQKHLIAQHRQEHDYQVDDQGREFYINEQGRKIFVMSADSWWLDNFDRKDVVLQLPGAVIMNTKPWHIGSVCISLRSAYGVRDYEECDDCFKPDDIQAHIERFPEGQFAAQCISGLHAGNCAGMATTMRTSRPPTESILPWMEAIGDLQLSAHEPEGEWLYGVEMAVHSMYQRHGIGTGLYEARFNMARQLNLRGWYAVGMLMGYRRLAVDALVGRQKKEMDERFATLKDRNSSREDRQKARTELGEFPSYSDLMDVQEYGERVIAGEIKDPTVTMQMNRGFRAERVVTDYVDEPAAGDAGVLIVWENPDYEA